ncbi:MAG: CehA/McbA family metallohydrolase [Sandaracinaceae bacterium]
MPSPSQNARVGLLVASLFGLTGCPEPDPPRDAGPPDAGSCDVAAFERGADGHGDPLGVGPGEARAGRIRADQLPPFASRLEVWEDGDFVLANERIAIVIEDTDDSDLYDPWGGRPVGAARVEGGALVEPADFGEILVMLGGQTTLTDSVTVLADGSDGGAAIVRAEGVPRALPFFAGRVGPLLPGDFSDFRVAIDYVLEPDAPYVDVFVELRGEAGASARSISTMHAFMHTPRMPPFAPGVGFSLDDQPVPYAGFASDGITGFAYFSPEDPLGGGIAISGFVSFLSRGISARGCTPLRRHHARIAIGGPGVDGVMRAVYETLETSTREVTGVVRDTEGTPIGDAFVLASDADGFVSRTTAGPDGSYRIALPADGAFELSAFQVGSRVSSPVPVDGASVDLELARSNLVHVVVTDESGAPIPARVQLFPVPGAMVGRPDDRFGIEGTVSGRFDVAYPETGDVTLRAPAERVRVVVSRGYEYELVDRTVDLSGPDPVDVPVMLERVIDTTGVMCADFHIHTHRSNDSGDDATLKVRQALADGLEIPVRSDHEYVGSFAREITALGMEAFAYGMGSIELTSFEQWEHMGVVPMRADASLVNAGAPRWQTYPTNAEPDQVVATMNPVDVFDAVRARAEAPVVIINHPRGDPNYFDYVGFDPVTGGVARADAWDERFTLVEVFNNSSWTETRDRQVRDWLALLGSGRRVFAVGSSDSHRIASSPVGYPRTCLAFGTDTPSELSDDLVRDTLAAGHGTVSGGIFVDTRIGAAGPGDEVGGVGPRARVHVRVQAASWVDVDAIDVVVDGAIVETIAILPEDADPMRPTTRLDQEIEIDVSTAGSYVLVAAYGDTDLEPVHRRRLPFGVSNPIFVQR